MNLGGLSPDKAPPAEAPLTLFYLSPLFLIAAGSVLAYQGAPLLASRWTPGALAVAHFLVLGALTPVMCGALLQISPVLIGAPYPRVRLVASLTAIGLGLGGLGIGLGFLLVMDTLLLLGACAVIAGLAVFLAASYRALTSAVQVGATLWTVRLAVVALAVTIGLGALLVLSKGHWLVLPAHQLWVDIHATWGLGGWIGLLFAGIGMEIIPMFCVAPAFPVLAKRLLPPLIFALLASSLLLVLRPSALPLNGLLSGLIAAHLAYNIIAIHVEHRRQRRKRDANLWLWQIGHAGVLAAAVAWIGGLPNTLLGILLIGSALAFAVGSLTKIVPFLNWLDLQQRRISTGNYRAKLPHMHLLLPPRRAAAIAATLIGAIVCALIAHAVQPMALASGILLASCGALLARALIMAARMRQKVARQLDASQAPLAVAPSSGPGANHAG